MLYHSRSEFSTNTVVLSCATFLLQHVRYLCRSITVHQLMSFAARHLKTCTAYTHIHYTEKSIGTLNSNSNRVYGDTAFKYIDPLLQFLL